MLVRRALALAVVVPLLLAGCADEPEPTPKMPESATSSPAPSPSESEAPETESAEDFIRRWAAALQVMQVSGETGAFRKLGPECESCSVTADRVEGIYQAGGAIEWDGWKILSIRPSGTSMNEFEVVERSAPTRYRESSEAPWQRLNGGRTLHVMELEPTGDSWVVVRTAELAQ